MCSFTDDQKRIASKRYSILAEKWNKTQKVLTFLNKIPYAKDYDKDIRKRISDIKLYHNIFNEIKKEKNKKSYLITLTSSCNLKEKLTKFIAELNYQKSLKKYDGLEFDYFAIIEPKKNGEPHLHIELVIDNMKGIYTVIKTILSKLDSEYKNFKKYNDNNSYLLKMLSESNYKTYVIWARQLDISFKKMIMRSRYIRISKNTKITLPEYKRILRILMKTRKKGHYIGLKQIRDYILMNPLYRVIKSIFSSLICIEKNTKSKKTLYRYINQVVKYYQTIINHKKEIDFKNNSP